MQTEFIDSNGERLKFIKTADETNGELLEMEAVYNPNSKPPPLHYHPSQEEQFEVLKGSFRVIIGETEHHFEPGDKFTSPPLFIQTILYNLLTPIGRRRGYQARYEKYSGEA